MRHNDRIIEVNGTNVENFDHGQVLKLITDSDSKVLFLVIPDIDNPCQKQTDAEEREVINKFVSNAQYPIQVNLP